MTFLEAVAMAREGHWIRSVEEGKEHPHRWLRAHPDSPMRSLDLVFADQPLKWRKGYIQPMMGTCDRFLGEWEAQAAPGKAGKR